MGYINFKEENRVAEKQLYNRISNNKKLFDDTRKDRTLAKDYSPYEKLSYKDFQRELFGKTGVEDEQNFIIIEKKDIVCSTFNLCKFQNILFKECNFIGCVFENCDFLSGGVSFESCSFIKSDSNQKPSLNKKDNFSCHFKNCKIYPKFLECDITYAIFENCLIKDALFQKTNMTGVIIYNSEMNLVNIEDSNLSGIKVIKTYICNFEFIDKKKSKLDEKSYFDKIPIRTRTRTKEGYEGIYMVYQSIADKFKENTLNNNFGEYYFLCKKVQRKALKPFPKFISSIYYYSCGYGERPEYALLFSIGIIVIFGFLYLLTGIDLDDKAVGVFTGAMDGIGIKEFIKYYNETLNISVGMFTGVGYIKGEPNEFSYILTDLEMILGTIMMGVGIGTLTRKIVR